MLIDTHAHLDFPEFIDDVPSVLQRAHQNGIEEVITIGIDMDSSRKAVELARMYSGIYASVGIHPHGARALDAHTLKTLQSIAGEEKVLAIGEIGLDYYRDRQPREIQRQCLGQQLDLALEMKLPVVLHIRDAFPDLFDIIGGYAPSLDGLVLHCFSGDWETARRCLDLGGYLSIPGTVTFPKAQIQHEVVMKAPLDRLLLETDCPYLTPVPHRGKNNEPSYLYYTALKVAELRGMTLEEVASRTTRNAHKVFRMESGGI